MCHLQGNKLFKKIHTRRTVYKKKVNQYYHNKLFTIHDEMVVEKDAAVEEEAAKELQFPVLALQLEPKKLQR